MKSKKKKRKKDTNRKWILYHSFATPFGSFFPSYYSLFLSLTLTYPHSCTIFLNHSHVLSHSLESYPYLFLLGFSLSHSYSRRTISVSFTMLPFTFASHSSLPVFRPLSFLRTAHSSHCFSIPSLSRTIFLEENLLHFFIFLLASWYILTSKLTGLDMNHLSPPFDPIEPSYSYSFLFLSRF